MPILFFYLQAVLETYMLVDMGKHRGLNHLSLRVLSYDLCNLWVLHGHHVDLDVSLVVLLDKCFDRNACQNVLVFLNRVGWNLIIFSHDKFFSVLDP